MTIGVFDEDTLPPKGVQAFGDLAPASRRAAYAVTWAGATAQGSGRQHNEDAWGERAGRAFAVADGMGGRAGGVGAAAAAVDGLLDELSSYADGIEWPEAISRVNGAVMRYAANAGHQQVGAAAAAFRYAGGRLTVVHLGDVRVYRLRGGQAELLTTDHTLGEELGRSGADPGSALPGGGVPRHLSHRQLAGLTTFFGDAESSSRFSVRTLSVQAGDRLVACTDGVYRHVPLRVWQDVAAQQACETAAQMLVRAATMHGTTDDATALVVGFAAEAR
jgi:serine/threonine protein phosphatase PrpC